VPPGNVDAWAHPPFAAAIDGEVLHGRGAVDMKSAIAAFIAAVSQSEAPAGSISLLITGDEEGEAEHGTRAVVAALADEGEVIDHCLVGEPTSSVNFGDMIKIGRRGTLNAEITVVGAQGHVAYPHRAANPAPVLVRYLAKLQATVLDEGGGGFQPSNLEIASIDIGNPAFNVIPASARARINIRFSPAHSGADLVAWLEEEARIANEGFVGKVGLACRIGGEPFLTEPGRFTDIIAGAVEAECGVKPELSTSGGTSDARFIRALCPVAEFGLLGTTMHKVDEAVPVAEVHLLTAVYKRLIGDYFAAF
jgi:succinyl-diaminopimelate desuccinylase